MMKKQMFSCLRRILFIYPELNKEEKFSLFFESWLVKEKRRYV